MSNSYPLFTIITATYNAANLLPELLDSLAAQSYRNFEVLIQDAASTDATLALAAHYTKKLPILSVQSEKDAGIYDAWNKALPRARGKWTIFLGADDRLAASDTLEKVAAALSNIPEQTKFVCGDVRKINEDGSSSHAARPMLEQSFAKRAWTIPFCHSSLFTQTALLQKELFNPNYRIAGDYEFICRTWRHWEEATQLEFIVTNMRCGGMSEQAKHVWQLRWEYARAASLYFSGVWTIRRCMGLFKAAIITSFALVFGNIRTRRMLAAIRQFCGLQPTW